MFSSGSFFLLTQLKKAFSQLKAFISPGVRKPNKSYLKRTSKNNHYFETRKPANYLLLKLLTHGRLLSPSLPENFFS